MRILGSSLFLLFAAAGATYAQEFTLANSQTSVSVTQSCGGTFKLQGSVGQPITTLSQGGGFSLNTSSVSIMTAVQTPNEPTLLITANNGVAILSWQVTSKSYHLEEAGTVDATVWQTLSQAPATNSGTITVSIPVVPDTRFFRLR